MATPAKTKKPALALALVVSVVATEREPCLDDQRLKRLTGYNITRANLRSLRAFASHVGHVGLKPAEFSVMVMIDANPGINQKQLGGALDISAPNLAVMLDQLGNRGLLNRVRSAIDRRLQHPMLTEAGARLIADAEELATEMEQRILDVLDEAERLTLIALLQKIAR